MNRKTILKSRSITTPLTGEFKIGVYSGSNFYMHTDQKNFHPQVWSCCVDGHRIAILTLDSVLSTFCISPILEHTGHAELIGRMLEIVDVHELLDFDFPLDLCHIEWELFGINTSTYPYGYLDSNVVEMDIQ